MIKSADSQATQPGFNTGSATLIGYKIPDNSLKSSVFILLTNGDNIGSTSQACNRY